MDKIDLFELNYLNIYLETELNGSLNLLNFIKYIGDSSLISKLLWHSEDEARHALLWANLLKSLQLPIINLKSPLDGGYPSFMAYKPKDILEFFIAFHIYELRVPFHFSLHAKWTQNDQIRKLCLQLVKEEGPHLSWIRDYLKKEYKKNPEKVKKAISKILTVERIAYIRDLDFISSISEQGHKFSLLAKKNLQDYNFRIDKYFNLHFY